jgi:hypothetical protein
MLALAHTVSNDHSCLLFRFHPGQVISEYLRHKWFNSGEEYGFLFSLVCFRFKTESHFVYVF